MIDDENLEQKEKFEKFCDIGNLTQRAIIAIGVLTTSSKPDSFFTASDVTEKLLQTSKLGELDDFNFFKINNKVNCTISQAYNNGTGEIIRSGKKITPVICKRKNIKTSYGFRIGLPSQKTKEEIHKGYELIKNPPVNNSIAEINNITDIPFLLKLQTDISARIEQLVSNMKEENYQLRDKIAKFKRVIKDIED